MKKIKLKNYILWATLIYTLFTLTLIVLCNTGPYIKNIINITVHNLMYAPYVYLALAIAPVIDIITKKATLKEHLVGIIINSLIFAFLMHLLH